MRNLSWAMIVSFTSNIQQWYLSYKVMVGCRWSVVGRQLVLVALLLVVGWFITKEWWRVKDDPTVITFS